MKRLWCFFTALVLLALAGCNNIDPGVRDDAGSSAYSSGEQSAPIPAYIDADVLAHRSYELRYLLAQERFSSPDDISVNALVQFAFCHIYYADLTAMPRSGNRLRQATPEEIRLQLLKYFGTVSADITGADLYNAGKGWFERWGRLYGTEIYYEAAVSRAGADTYQVRTTFFTDADQTEVQGKTVLTVQDVDGHVQIRRLTSSK